MYLVAWANPKGKPEAWRKEGFCGNFETEEEFKKALKANGWIKVQSIKEIPDYEVARILATDRIGVLPEPNTFKTW